MARRGAAAPPTSPTRRSSGTPPWARAVAAAAAGGGGGRCGGVEVGARREVAGDGKGPGYLLGPRVVAGNVINHAPPAEGARPERASQIGLDLAPAVPDDADGLGHHRVVH